MSPELWILFFYDVLILQSKAKVQQPVSLLWSFFFLQFVAQRIPLGLFRHHIKFKWLWWLKMFFFKKVMYTTKKKSWLGTLGKGRTKRKIKSDWSPCTQSQSRICSQCCRSMDLWSSMYNSLCEDLYAVQNYQSCFTKCPAECSIPQSHNVRWMCNNGAVFNCLLTLQL